MTRLLTLVALSTLVAWGCSGSEASSASGPFLPFTHKSQSYVLVLQPETYVDAADVCASHPGLPGPGSLITTEAMVPLFFELYVANPSLGNRLIILMKNVSRSAPRVQEDFEMWIFDRYRACRGGVNVLASSSISAGGGTGSSSAGGSIDATMGITQLVPVTENFLLTTDVPCDWRLSFVCTEERTARALGMPVSSEWLAQYRAAQAAPSPFRLGPAGSGLALVRSDLLVGDSSPPPGTTVAFDEGERFWRQGPVLGALYRGTARDLYALKPLREADGLDPWQLLNCDRNQSCLAPARASSSSSASLSSPPAALASASGNSSTANVSGAAASGDFYGAFEPARDGGAAWEGYNTLPYDYVVRVSGCFRGPVVERLFLTTRTGRRYQLGRGGCSTRFVEAAPPGGYLAGFAGAYMNVSSWPPGPPPYAQDPIFIRQLRFIWAVAAPVAVAGSSSDGAAAAVAAAALPSYSLEPLPAAAAGAALPVCATARRTVVSRVGQLPGVCGGPSGALCPSSSCCALAVSNDGAATSPAPQLGIAGACGSGLMACQISCDPGYGLCGTVPEHPIKAFVNLEAFAGPSVYHVTEQHLTYNDAVSYCRSSTYMGMAWRIADMDDVFGLTASLDVRHQTYVELTGERFWISIRDDDTAGPATYPCLTGAFGVPRGNETYPHSFWPSLCLDAHMTICRASVAAAGAAAGSPSSGGGGAGDANATSALVAAGVASADARWVPGPHAIHVSKMLGAGPFGASCTFLLAPDVVAAAAAAGTLLKAVNGSSSASSSATGSSRSSSSSGSSGSSSTPVIAAALVTARLVRLSVGVITAVYNDTDPIDQVSGIRLGLQQANALQLVGSSSTNASSSNGSSTGTDASATLLTAGVAGSGGWYDLQPLGTAEGEVVVAVSGCAGGFVERLVFHTSSGRQWTTPFTRASLCSASFLELPPPGGYLVGVQGYMGWQHMEALQLIWGVPLQAQPPAAPPPGAGGGESSSSGGGGGGGSAANTGLVVGLVVGLAALSLLLAVVAAAMLVRRFCAALLRCCCTCCGWGRWAGGGGAPKEAELVCPASAPLGPSNGSIGGGGGSHDGGPHDTRTTPISLISGTASEAVPSSGLGMEQATHGGSARQAQQKQLQPLLPPLQHEHIQASGCSSSAADAPGSALASGSSAVRLELAAAGAPTPGAAADTNGGSHAGLGMGVVTTWLRRGQSMQHLHGGSGSGGAMASSAAAGAAAAPALPAAVSAAAMELMLRLPGSGQQLGRAVSAQRSTTGTGAGAAASPAAAALANAQLWQPVDLATPAQALLLAPRQLSQQSSPRVDPGQDGAATAAAQVRHMLLCAASQVRTALPEWAGISGGGGGTPAVPDEQPQLQQLDAAASSPSAQRGGGWLAAAAGSASCGGGRAWDAAMPLDGAGAAPSCGSDRAHFSAAGATTAAVAAAAGAGTGAGAMAPRGAFAHPASPGTGAGNNAAAAEPPSQQQPGRLSELIRRHVGSSTQPATAPGSGASAFVAAAPPAVPTAVPQPPGVLVKISNSEGGGSGSSSGVPLFAGRIPAQQVGYSAARAAAAATAFSASAALGRSADAARAAGATASCRMLAGLRRSTTAVDAGAAAGAVAAHDAQSPAGGGAASAGADSTQQPWSQPQQPQQQECEHVAADRQQALHAPAMSLESPAAAAVGLSYNQTGHMAALSTGDGRCGGSGDVGGAAAGVVETLRGSSFPTPANGLSGTRVLGFLPPPQQQASGPSHNAAVTGAAGGRPLSGRASRSDTHVYAQAVSPAAAVVGAIGAGGSRMASSTEIAAAVAAARSGTVAAALAAATTTAPDGHAVSLNAGQSMNVVLPPTAATDRGISTGGGVSAYGGLVSSFGGYGGGTCSGGENGTGSSALTAASTGPPGGDPSAVGGQGADGSYSGASSHQELGLTRLVLGRDVELEEDSFLGQGASGTVRRGVLKLAAAPAVAAAADGGAGLPPAVMRVPVAVKMMNLGVTDYYTPQNHHQHGQQQQRGHHGGSGVEHADSGGAYGGGGGGDGAAMDPHLKALAAEVHVLSRLDHPNVIRFYGCNLAPPRPFIVEELMALPLSRLIHGKERDGSPSFPYGLPDVLRIARDIAAALAYLHPTVLHRDLKPGNVLLDESGTAKIGDFGLARFKANTQLSATNLEVGTTAFCPPEVFTPTEAKVTDRADVWAFGMVLYEMVTRKRPWEGTRNAVIGYLVAIERRRPELPEPGHPLCPPPLRSLIERCWRHNPEERPAAAEVLKRLTLLLAAHGGGEALLAARGGGAAAAGAPTGLVRHHPQQQAPPWTGPRSQPHAPIAAVYASAARGSGGDLGGWEGWRAASAAAAAVTGAAAAAPPHRDSVIGSGLEVVRLSQQPILTSGFAGGAAVAPGAVMRAGAAGSSGGSGGGSCSSSYPRLLNPRLLQQSSERHGSSAPRTFVAAATIPEVPTAAVDEPLTNE
ncbi:hypothetical protein HXX76_003739 [Chlamydomonas incerta]|uniref:Protein kinase domain-containing protein n=1 Tax=Chlamydomonas incerta TaxID=51695 RepID=A0A835TNA0_CHLIN|nr:hypothetical protein HXX76_003739 [Chlamydomonas incerta]|eukprot:KAG2440885.1 hypothetical protein HXX76_003739 [Chlamydomonas incerta]